MEALLEALFIMKKMLESENHHSANTNEGMDLGNNNQWLLQC